MKSSTLILLVGLSVALVCVHGAPASEKQKTASTPTTVSPSRKCKFECSNDLNPVCGTDGDIMNLTFVNKCVMDEYNCKHDAKLTVRVEAECPNSKGIRLA